VSFTSLKKYLRTKAFPIDTIPLYADSQNADAICDLNGAQWVRDTQSPTLPGPGPGSSFWFVPTSTSFLVTYLYKAIVTADEHAGTWDSDKLYFQLHTGGINPGDVPLFSGAVPDGPGILDIDFGVSSPLYNPTAFYYAFSSTPLVYTASARTAHVLICASL
jgi:hypothetical protein